MNKYAKNLCDAVLSNNPVAMHNATADYMKAAACALNLVQLEFACPIRAPLIVVADAFANSLKLLADEATMKTVEKLREKCTVITTPVNMEFKTGCDES